MTYLIGCDLDMSGIPFDPIGAMFGDIDPVHEGRESAMDAIAELERSGDWPDGRPTYRLGSTAMPAAAARALYRRREYDIGAVLVAWESGDYGDLTDSQTGETIRLATVDEAVASLTAAHEGHIEIDGRDCYVSL